MNAWFSRLGQPVTDDERRQVGAYLRGLGIAEELEVESVMSWGDARAVVTQPAWDRRWWDAEQLEKQRLYARAVANLGPTDLLQSLSRVLESGEAMQGAASRMAERSGSDDPALAHAAAGAASVAFHLAELARLAGESEAHPFRLKHSLFLAGRWPLGISSGRYSMF